MHRPLARNAPKRERVRDLVESIRRGVKHDHLAVNPRTTDAQIGQQGIVVIDGRIDENHSRAAAKPLSLLS